MKCQSELENQPNPTIVIITDGEPTRCLDTNGVAIGEGSSKNQCAGGVSAQQAAEDSATIAAGNGMTILPVSIAEEVGGIPQVNRYYRIYIHD